MNNRNIFYTFKNKRAIGVSKNFMTAILIQIIWDQNIDFKYIYYIVHIFQGKHHRLRLLVCFDSKFLLDKLFISKIRLTYIKYITTVIFFSNTPASCI